MVGARGWGRARGSWSLMGRDFQLRKMKIVLEMGGGDGCTAT